MATSEHSFSKLERTEHLGAKVAIAGGRNLILASGVTLILLFGMVVASFLALIFILENPNPTLSQFKNLG